MDIIDIYTDGVQDKQKVVLESIKEVDDKLKNEKDAGKRTKLMYEQMLRGLYLTQCPDFMR